MTTYAVNISSLNASVRSLEERVINFSLMQFQVSPQAFHPEKIHVIFDACHMLKLMRNLLVEYEDVTFMENGQTYKVSWKYIFHLNDVQGSTGFKLATKLKKRHIDWTQHKMNVSMAAQTLSSPVVDGIEFLCFGMQMEECQDSYGTVKFIHKVEGAFEGNPCDEGAKTPVTAQKLATWQNDAESLAKFILELRDSCGRLLHNSPYKTPILGFAISLCSMADICQHLLKHQVAPFGHILTYTFSQDHLELLFNKYGTDVAGTTIQMYCNSNTLYT